MNQWKYVIANACITAVLIAAGITLLLPAMEVGEPPFATALNRKTGAIEERLARIERSLGGRESAAMSLAKPEHATSNEIEHVSAKLDTILAKLSSMEAKSGNEPRVPMRGMPIPGVPGMSERGRGPGGGERPTSWIDSLPEEKQAAVRQIFRENARIGREKFGAERDEGRPSPERMKEMKEEQDAFLKERLQEVLTDEEYQSYVESLPEAAAGKIPVPGFMREPSPEKQSDSR